MHSFLLKLNKANQEKYDGKFLFLFTAHARFKLNISPGFLRKSGSLEKVLKIGFLTQGLEKVLNFSFWVKKSGICVLKSGILYRHRNFFNSFLPAFFKMETRNILASLTSKLLEKAPIRYAIVRNLECLVPKVIIGDEARGVRLLKNLLTSLS